jgi:uncharacterized DUF497 family protein
VRFEWDDEKAVANLEKHGVSFGEATEVFYDPNALEGFDAEHSVEENRFFIIGLSSRRLLYVTQSVRATRCESSQRVARWRGRKSFMDKKQAEDGFAFTVVEDDGQNVTIEVSEEDYRRELAAGLSEESLLKPGRYKMKRGGFLARHPELKIKERRSA